MAGNLFQRAGRAVKDHVLDYAKETDLHGINYFANRGTIEGGTDVKTGETILIKMSRFDR